MASSSRAFCSRASCCQMAPMVRSTANRVPGEARTTLRDERVLVEAGVVGEGRGEDRLAGDEADDDLGGAGEGRPVRLRGQALDVPAQRGGVGGEQLGALDLGHRVAVRLEEVRHRRLASRRRRGASRAG